MNKNDIFFVNIVITYLVVVAKFLSTQKGIAVVSVCMYA